MPIPKNTQPKNQRLHQAGRTVSIMRQATVRTTCSSGSSHARTPATQSLSRRHSALALLQLGGGGAGHWPFLTALTPFFSTIFIAFEGDVPAVVLLGTPVIRPSTSLLFCRSSTGWGVCAMWWAGGQVAPPHGLICHMTESDG